MSYNIVIKELQKSIRHYDNEANRVLELDQNEYEYNRFTLIRDRFADAVEILEKGDSRILDFMNLISKTPQAELEAYSNEELVNGFIQKNNALGGFIKPVQKMNGQELLNAIATLSGALDSLTRAGQKEAANEVSEKIRELVKKLT